MNEKMKNVWLEFEKELGRCCLHKKAAFYEVAESPVNQLSLVTTAPAEAIDASIGESKCERLQNRYIFTHKGVSVELTTLSGVVDLDELYEKSFRHTLTIDSVGIGSDGRITNVYRGVEDIKNKVLRLTSPSATISESLMRRMMMLMMSGYRIDEELKKRISEEKFFEKIGYRKKFFETLISTVNGQKNDWGSVATLLGILGTTLERRKTVISYTEKLDADMVDPRFRKAYLFLIFALVKATSKELVPLMQNEKMIEYYDSVCANLYKKIKTYPEFKKLKESYGDEFMDLLFDVQELWMKIENVPYKRPSEKDFDMMSQLIAESKYWSNPDEPIADEKNNDEESFELEGTLDFEKTVVGGYSEEDYDEPMEGAVEDDYVVTEEASYIADDTDSPNSKPIEEPRPIKKKAICIDDDIPDVEDTNGLIAEGLAAYEEEIQGRSKPKSTPVNQLSNSGGTIHPAREHKSKVLMSGGE